MTVSPAIIAITIAIITILAGYIYLLGAGGRGGCSVWKLQGSSKAELVSSKKLGGGGGGRAAAAWRAGEGLAFCVGFDDGRCEVWELGSAGGCVIAAPVASSCAVRSLVCHTSQSSSAAAAAAASQLFVGHTNGMVHMYKVSVGSNNFSVELCASIR